MADKVITIKLQRGDGTSWGFRLAGGKDFGYPLSVQRVNPGGLAEQGGLQTGDALIRIQGKSTDDMRHKEAQDAIVRAGNYLELSIQRGASMTWKPKVTPVGAMPKPSPLKNGEPAPVTKTSLAANKQPYKPIGTGHNVAAKPFATVPTVVHNPYNSPAPLYSMNNIADTLAAQTEVLTTGAVGINFMKGDKPLNKESAVYRMVLEEDKHPKAPGSPVHPPGPQTPSTQHPLSVSTQQGPSPLVNLRHVEAPKTGPPSAAPNTAVGAPTTCADCGRLIVGVFVRIKDNSYHAECFRCATCGTSLKNIGYFNINNKLYCDIHAKGAARHIAPAANMEPLTISPGSHVPASVPQAAPMHSPSTFPRAAPYSPVPAQHSPAPRYSPVPPPTAIPVAADSDESGVCTDSLVAQGLSAKRPVGPQTPLAATKPATPQTPRTAPLYGGGPQPHHPITAPSADVHTPTHGGAKFTWPPPQPGGPVPLAGYASPTSAPSGPGYRPPPGTQHVAPSSSVPTAATPSTPHSSPFFPSFSSPAASPASSRPASFASTAAHPYPGVKVPPPTAPKPSPLAAKSPQQGLMTAKPAYGGGGGTPLTATTSGTPGSRPAPRRGRGQLHQVPGAGLKIPICASCGSPIRGPFVTALGKNWCPDHFLCSNRTCNRSLQDTGFVEEQGKLYCENCYESYLAPVCRKCGHRIKGDCLNALEQTWHPECFVCTYCKTAFGNSSFYLEDGLPYCEKDWNELFTSKCVGCGYPIEAGDRWVEALNNNYHSQCFKCTICHSNLEGQSFYAKGGRPICKAHAR